MSYFIVPTPEEIREFVRQSNAIEGILSPESSEFFLDHIGAVNAAIKSISGGGFIPTPREIHAILMRSQPEKMPGEYRSVGVLIGKKIRTPPPDSVSLLMRNLLDNVNMGVSQGIHGELWIWDAHNELEAIHPFMDGNGRTGRIWMNAIRLRLGLSWLIIRAEERQEYYRRIDEFRRRSLRYEQYLPDTGNQLDIETICEEPSR